MSSPDGANGKITWKWVAAALAAFLAVASGAWLTQILHEVAQIHTQQTIDRSETQDLKSKAGAIEERTKRTEQDVRDIKEETRALNRKMDDLLRRTQ